MKPEDAVRLADELERKEQATEVLTRVEKVEVRPGTLPVEKWEAAMENSPTFAQTWRRDRRERARTGILVAGRSICRRSAPVNR